MNYAKRHNELHSLHRLLTRIRSQAYLDCLSAKELGRLLDDAEYLTSLIISGDTDDEFRRLLAEIEARHSGFDDLLTAYDAELKDSISTAINMPAAIVE